MPPSVDSGVDPGENPVARRRPFPDEVSKGVAFFLFAILAGCALAHGAVELRAQIVFEASVLVALILWIGVSVGFGRLRVYRGVLDLPALGLLALVLVSFPFSRAPDLSERGVRLAAAELGFFFLCSQLIRRGQSVVRLARWMMFLGAAYAVLGLTLFESSLFGLRTFSARDHRISLTFTNSNHFAGWLAGIALLAVGAAFASRGIKRILFAGLALFIEVAIVLSASRGGFLSLLAGLLFLGVFFVAGRSRSDRKITDYSVLFALPVAVAAVVLYIGPGTFLKRIETLKDPLAAGATRLSIWRGTLSMIADHPWAGTGAGTFQLAFPPYQPEGLAWTVVNHAHNDYLELAAEIGLPALAVAVIGIFALFAAAFRKLFRDGSDRTERWLRAGALAGCLAALLHAMTEFNFQIPSNVVLFFALASIAISPMGEPGRSVTWVDRNVPAKWRFSLVSSLVLLALLGLWRLAVPLRADAFFRDSRTALEEGDTEGAFRLTREALRLEPRFAELWAEAGRLERLRALNDAKVRQEGLISALHSYIEADLARPGSLSYAGDRGAIFRDLGRFPEAERELLRSLHDDPVRAIAHFELGSFYLAAGRFRDSIAPFRRSVELDPEFLERVLEELFWIEASDEELAAIVPKDARSRQLYAEFLFQGGDSDRAVAQLEFAFRLEPNPGNALAHLRGLDRAGRAGEALPVAERYLGRYPQDGPLIGEAITLLIEMNAFERASQLYEERIAAEPQNPAWMAGLGALDRRLDCPVQAVSLLERAASLSPSDPRVFFQLGLAEHEAGDLPRGLQALQRAVILDGGNALYRQELGFFYREAGLVSLASAEFRKCLDLDPDNRSCQAGYGTATPVVTRRIRTH